jgi:hypothetical protein
MNGDVTWLAGRPLAPARLLSLRPSVTNLVPPVENRLVPSRVLFTGPDKTIAKALKRPLWWLKAGFSWVRIWVRTKSTSFVFNNVVASNLIFSHFLAFLARDRPIPSSRPAAGNTRYCILVNTIPSRKTKAYHPITDLSSPKFRRGASAELGAVCLTPRFLTI